VPSPRPTHRARRGLSLVAAVALGGAALGCTPPPPRSWTGGGTLLEIPRAQWILGEEAVELLPGGEVLVDGDLEMAIDRVGRVYDEEGDPVAVLEPDGGLVGNDDVDMGMVGSRHASLPESGFAWITVEPNGQVIRYGSEGQRHPFGAWFGCGRSPRAQQACTLVSHVLGMRMRRRARDDGPSFGFGMGVTVPVR
jgi:hypothetical protein